MEVLKMAIFGKIDWITVAAAVLIMLVIVFLIRR